MSARWNENRKIAQRIVITGNLVLLTPARLGGGDGDVVTDMPILRDAKENKPLLTGSSIAGAMRSYLRERDLGYEKAEPGDGTSLAQALFGDVLENVPVSKRRSVESYLVIEDAYAETKATEFRPGVKIDPQTRIAAKAEDDSGQLYDIELLQAGASFPLRMELDLPEDEARQAQLKKGLAIALTGFELGEIGLGARKRRGFGECQVLNFQVQAYNLRDPQQLIEWIKRADRPSSAGKTIAAKLGVVEPLPDGRKRFTLQGDFYLQTSLLSRSGSGGADAPDMVHLKSKRGGDDKPILSGTSLAGAMRARALRIAQTVLSDKSKARKLVEELFGPDKIERQADRKSTEAPFASRILVHEREVKGKTDLVQTRIRIDRFTGGTFSGALFDQQPVFGGHNSLVSVDVELRNPRDAHIGLLLHILKDLWTGDLPLGGEASTGRGRLAGKQAILRLHEPGKADLEWQIEPGAKEASLKITGDLEKLNTYATSVGGAQ